MYSGSIDVGEKTTAAVKAIMKELRRQGYEPHIDTVGFGKRPFIFY